jgi:hypothetical protein
MASCQCDCGESVTAGDFLPGHDQNLRTKLENRVGGLLALKELVLAAKKYSCGELRPEELENLIRCIFAAKDRR